MLTVATGRQLLVAAFACGLSYAADSGEALVALDAREAPVVEIVQALAEAGGFQVVFDPGLDCRLTMKIPGARWRTVLEAALSACGLAFEEEAGILRVARLSRLKEESAARRRLDDERRSRQQGRLASFRLSYARAREVAPLLERALSPSGRVSYDSRTNALIIAY